MARRELPIISNYQYPAPRGEARPNGWPIPYEMPNAKMAGVVIGHFEISLGIGYWVLDIINSQSHRNIFLYFV